MRDDHAINQELEKARAAYDAKRYLEAQAHLTKLEQMGAPASAVRPLRKLIQTHRAQQVKMAQNCGWVGFGLATAGYLILMCAPPRFWTIPFWVLLAFGGIPCVAGWAVGRLAGYDAGRAARFWRAAWACGTAMGGYAFISLLWKRTRFELGEDGGQVALIWTLLPLLYGAIAGTVAGAISARLVWLKAERGSHGTTSG